MHRRILLALALLIALTTAFGVAQEGDKIQLLYWRSLADQRGEAQDELVRRFNESQDEIEVEVQFQGDYGELTQKLTAALAANQVPDVFLICDTCMPPFARSDVMQPLDPFIDAEGGMEREDFLGDILQGGVVDDQLYIIPFAASTPIMFYNPEMLEQAGLEGPPETWEELFDYSRQVSETIEGAYGFSMWISSWWLQSQIWSQGGQFSNADFETFVDSDVWIESLTNWRDLIHNDNAARVPTEAEGGTFGDFANQRAAIMFSSTANITSILEQVTDFEPQAAFLPAGSEGRVVPTGGSGIGMIAGLPEEKAQAAWEFISFMTSPASNAYFTQETGYIPYTEGAVAELEGFMAENPLFRVAVDQLQYARNQSELNGTAEASSILGTALERVFIVGEDPAAVLPEAQEEIQAAIQEEGLR